MRNVLLFFRRYSTFFTFLLLQIISLSIVFKYNKSHSALGLTMANNVTGALNTQYSKIQLFLQGKKSADSLLIRNAELLNTKPNNYLIQDTSIKEIADYIPIDTIGNTKKILQFIYRPAVVIYNTTNDDLKNYMMLNRGTTQGITTDMAVIGAESNGVVGKVIYADANYALVMTLLHVQSSIPAKLKRSSDNGTIYWDGNSTSTVTMKRVPKTATILKGDTILTSNNSDIFPQDLIIGTIADFKEDKTTGNYIIKVKPRVNFNHINYVQVIENTKQKETRTTLLNGKKALENKL